MILQHPLVNFKIPSGTIVYFAVDYDATEAEVESNIIPYFKAIYDTFDEINMHGYKIGIYGPRYVTCERSRLFCKQLCM